MADSPGGSPAVPASTATLRNWVELLVIVVAAAMAVGSIRTTTEQLGIEISRLTQTVSDFQRSVERYKEVTEQRLRQREIDAADQEARLKHLETRPR